jgi:hypothetical protein
MCIRVLYLRLKALTSLPDTAAFRLEADCCLSLARLTCVALWLARSVYGRKGHSSGFISLHSFPPLSFQATRVGLSTILTSSGTGVVFCEPGSDGARDIAEVVWSVSEVGNRQYQTMRSRMRPGPDQDKAAPLPSEFRTQIALTAWQ